jgi:phosphatidylethanolamine-binding protein (PEBP) family uncharacterized protein
MAVIARRIVVPIAGKSDLALERARRGAAIFTKAGATVRVVKVIMGADTGNIETFARYSDFSAGTKSFIAASKDPDAIELAKEREVNPAGEVLGPYVYRTVFGEITAQPVLVQRMYQISRQNLKDALALLPEARAAFDDTVGMAAVVPVFDPQMDRLVISYYANSIEHLGSVLDTQAMTDAFQAVALKASKFGTLIGARVLTVI